MFKNYLKTAWRNMLRYKGFSMINILGLAIGMSCCLLVTLFIIDELSYDRYHKDASRIHRVVKDFVNNDGSALPDATTPPAIGPAIRKEIPEIEEMTRIFPGWGNKFYVRNGDKRFIEENLYRADSSIFDVFSFQFIRGDQKTAFINTNAIVLTESTAKKYFGNEDPIGKTLEVDNWQPQVVTAVISDLPDNSHFSFDLLAPLRFYDNNRQLRDINSNWNWYNYYTYIKLKPGASIAKVDPKIRGVFKQNQPEDKNHFYSQPLTSIHLSSNLKWELSPNSDRSYIYIFGTVALFILLIACINYINLTTARSTLRAKEIGVRKVAGAGKNMLLRQFLAESVFTAIIAAIFSLIIAQLILPSINSITGKQMTIFTESNLSILIYTLLFAVLLGIAAGFYPAIFLSSLQPVKVIKGERLSGNQSFSLRKVLVVTQFAISIILIIGSIVVIQQINFIQNTKLGFNKEHMVMLNDIAYLNRSERQTLKNDLLNIPGVKKVAATDGFLGGQNWTTSLRLKGSENGQLMNFLSVDYDYLDAMDIEMKEGRGYGASFMSDSITYTGTGTDRRAGGIVLNETAVKALSIKSPAVGQQLVWDTEADTTWYLEIIGVMKDFHFASMKNEIKPFAFVNNNNRQGLFAIKLSGDKMESAIDQINSIWDKNIISRPFHYTFLDETFAKLYKSENNFKKIFFYITAIAIFIACLGLFGLSSFMTEQRAKEIGIRKVLGASISGITVMLSGNFLKLVLIAAIIAFPIAWWVMHQWLLDFAYRVSISWWIFIVATITALAIAFLTVGFQAMKAALMNPVRSLRTE